MLALQFEFDDTPNPGLRKTLLMPALGWCKLFVMVACYFMTKHCLANKIAIHQDKQLTPSESWNQDGFLSLGLGYHQIQIVRPEFVQRCGHQIRVNTWTGSYPKKHK